MSYSFTLKSGLGDCLIFYLISDDLSPALPLEVRETFCLN